MKYSLSPLAAIAATAIVKKLIDVLLPDQSIRVVVNRMTLVAKRKRVVMRAIMDLMLYLVLVLNNVTLFTLYYVFDDGGKLRVKDVVYISIGVYSTMEVLPSLLMSYVRLHRACKGEKG